jgi:2'-5' RNA ligase
VTRAFVAIRPPEPVLDAVAERIAAVDLGEARRAPREQWHITLQFLGNDADIEAVVAALVGLECAASVVQLGPMMPIGNPKRSQVCAFTIAEGRFWLRDLAGEVAARLAVTGFVVEARPFFGHLTFGRFRTSRNVMGIVEALGPEPVGAPWLVDELVVFESRLGSGPAEHIARATIPLRSP